jgi:hypothetical protein
LPPFEKEKRNPKAKRVYSLDNIDGLELVFVKESCQATRKGMCCEYSAFCIVYANTHSLGIGKLLE